MNLSGIFALWYRDVLRYFSSKIRIVASLGVPFFYMVAFGFGLNSFAIVSGVSYFDFLVPGMIGMTLLFQSMFGGLSVVEDKQFGFFKEILVAPISRFEIVFGKAMGTATVASFQAIIIFIIAILLGFNFNFSLVSLLLFLLLIFLVSIGFAGVGLGAAAKISDPQGFQLVFNFLIMPVFVLSGAFYPIDRIPVFLRLAAIFDPLTYGIGALRAVLVGHSFFPLFYSAGIVIAFDIVALVVASYLFNQTE